jgi:hypothetical protein
MTASARPWTTLDPGVAEALRPVLPEVVETTFADIAREIPTLGRNLDGPFGQALHRGVELALGRFLDLLGTSGDALTPRLAQVYESFGEQESQQGRALDALLAAYRLGARVTWRHFSAAAVGAGVATGQLITLAEAIFVYIDELSAASARGHSRHHAAQAGFRDVLRSRLAAAILAGEAATAPASVHNLAADVGWVLPERLAVAVMPTPSDLGARQLPIAPPDILLLGRDVEILAILPDPSGPTRRTRLAWSPGTHVEIYVGTVRPPEEAPISLADARSVGRLVQEGVLPRAPVVSAADHLPELVLHADPRLLADLSERALAPLAELAPGRRAVLTQTLRSWLHHQGDRTATAAMLGVHPQTVSYRMARLTELFGDALSDPRQRTSLIIALEAAPPRSEGEPPIPR